MQIRKISANMFLNCKYRASLRELNRCIQSVKSKTLDEIYTDEFKLTNPNSGLTTVKNLKTNKPEIVKIFESKSSDKENEYTLETLNGERLGKKRFTIRNNKFDRIFTPGCIESYKNNNYAGTQVRLLQATCELAKKMNIREMSIESLLQAVIFHAKMGFKPDRSFSFLIDSYSKLNDRNKILLEFWHDCLRPEFYTPILSKDSKGNYFLDANRTLFCSAIKQNMAALEKAKQRNLIFNSQTYDDTIMMTLSGNDLDKWYKRLSDFEILPQEKKNLVINSNTSNKNIDKLKNKLKSYIAKIIQKIEL